MGRSARPSIAGGHYSNAGGLSSGWLINYTRSRAAGRAHRLVRSVTSLRYGLGSPHRTISQLVSREASVNRRLLQFCTGCREMILEERRAFAGSSRLRPPAPASRLIHAAAGALDQLFYRTARKRAVIGRHLLQSATTNDRDALARANETPAGPRPLQTSRHTRFANRSQGSPVAAASTDNYRGVMTATPNDCVLGLTRCTRGMATPLC